MKVRSHASKSPGRALWIVLACTCLLLPGFKWEIYVARTLSSIIDDHESMMNDGRDAVFTADNFPTKTNVRFLGEIRKIPEERRVFVADYFGKMRGKPEWGDLFQHEIRCMEGDREFWLPIQEQVLAFFREEVPRDSMVELYVLWIGAQKRNDTVDWVFTVSEFQVHAARK